MDRYVFHNMTLTWLDGGVTALDGTIIPIKQSEYTISELVKDERIAQMIRLYFTFFRHRTNPLILSFSSQR